MGGEVMAQAKRTLSSDDYRMSVDEARAHICKMKKPELDRRMRRQP